MQISFRANIYIHIVAPLPLLLEFYTHKNEREFCSTGKKHEFCVRNKQKTFRSARIKFRKKANFQHFFSPLGEVINGNVHTLQSYHFDTLIPSINYWLLKITKFAFFINLSIYCTLNQSNCTHPPKTSLTRY
jgi:hypothetical protein